MSTTAFPVRQSSDGVGCTDVVLRHIVAALYPDTGVVNGLKVTGTNSAAYNVAAGVAVCSKASSDGNTLAYWEGGTAATSANSSSNPRIDLIWIASHDLTQGDDDNLVTVGVTQGTPAASPQEPTLPAGATRLVAMQVPGGAASTSAATVYGVYDYAVPYGGSSGILFDKVNTANNQTYDLASEMVVVTGSFTTTTKRHVQIGITITASAVNGTIGTANQGSLYGRLYIDGKAVDIRETRVVGEDNAVSTFYAVYTDVGAGTHSIKLSYTKNGMSKARFRYGSGWAGQRVVVFDAGVAD